MIALLLWVGSALALEVVATLPVYGAVAQDLAPDAQVTVLVRPQEDPHYLSPTPALMARVGRADLYVENGLNLELWSSRLLDGAGNPDIRPGRPRYVKASDGVPRLEVPAELTRAQGDLHPQGNPHVWLDPLNLPQVADNIAAGLARVDPARGEAYSRRAAAFRQEVYVWAFGQDLVDFMGGELLERLARAGRLHDFLASKGLDPRLGGSLGRHADLVGRPVVFYHQSWAYLVDRYGLRVVGYVEDRPGIAPSAAHRDELARAMEAAGVTWIGVTVYYDDRLARALAERTGARVARLPGDVGALPAASGPLALLDAILGTL